MMLVVQRNDTNKSRLVEYAPLFTARANVRACDK